MPLQVCINGHRWESRDGSASCPVCGPTDASRVPVIVHGPDSASTPDTVPMTVEAPPRLPGFEILEEAGQGGMGVVYKAREISQDRIVALKVIRAERRDNEEILSRFRREFEAAARLSHPNVVSVYSYSQMGDVHVLSMEYVEGLTLQKRVEESGPLDPSLACEVVRQAALGLQHIGDRSLVHRDVKPANLMLQLPVSPSGGRGRPLVKILDLGVARLYQLREHADEALATLTREGVVLGTPDYMAPEQLENPHGIDIRADLYSLGCVFYFLLTGTVLFPGSNMIQKLDKHRWAVPLSVEQIRPSVPRPVAAVVRRLLNKTPDDRYTSPVDLALALEQLQKTGELPPCHHPEPLQAARTLTGHTKPVVAVAFHGPRQAITAGAERVVLLADLTSGLVVRRWTEASADVTGLVVIPGREQMLVAQGVSVRIYDLTTGKEVRRLMGHSDAVRGVAVSHDGRFALTGGDDRTLRLWDLGTGREARRMTGHRGRISSVAISRDGKLGVSGDRDGGLRLWEVLPGREVRTIAAPKGAILGVVFAPDGRTIATAHYDTTVRLWEADSGRELRRFLGHRQMVNGVAFSPDGARLVSGGNDRMVIVWDVGSGAEVSSGTGHTDAVMSVAFSPDGTQVLSGANDRTVRLWQVP